jgi:hypothetical protein
MVNRKSVNWAAGAVVLAAAGWLYLFLFPTPPAIDARPHQGLGEVIAAEALKLLEPGARLIVITRDQESFVLPAMSAQLESFLKAVTVAGKAPHAVRAIKVDPLRVVSVPPGDFHEMLRQGKDNDVIVSFLGPPALNADQLLRLGTKRCRVVALCSGAMPARIDLKKAFELKLLHVAIVSRTDAPAQATAGSSRAAFDQFFKVVTEANLADLTASGSASAAN